MAASTVVPLSEYLRTSYRPDRDWIDGEVRERNMGELPHAAVLGFFTRRIGNHAAEWQVRVYRRDEALLDGAPGGIGQ